MNAKLAIQTLSTDLLILGGGAAGCYASLSFCEVSGGDVIIVEKANIRRSGCLAAGVNAINAYITPGRTPEDYAAYAKKDAEGIVRKDLLLTMAQGLNRTVSHMEALGLVILKDKDGKYMTRGDRNIKINGENIKPILADAVLREPRIHVLNRVNAIDYMIKDGRIRGVYAVGTNQHILYRIFAKAVLCATGGAAGLYKPNNPGFSRHKMWYPPFNTGGGYAMGIRAGAEMTTFEMRFIALRCKDTIAPTGTLAQGVGAKQINAAGEVYEQKYGLTTSQRVYGTVTENREGRGPCFLKTVGITEEQDTDLQCAYLNMAPSQTLKWLESGEIPSVKNVEIEGTEPYIVGGHTASGYWVDTDRQTTIRGLFAAGDVAGGCPQKYVTGAFVEGEIAAKAAARMIESDRKEQQTANFEEAEDAAYFERSLEEMTAKLEAMLHRKATAESEEILEEEMQAVMDHYAGGIGTDYRFTEESLLVAGDKIRAIERRSDKLGASDMQSLLRICELKERLTVCKTVIAHLEARKETRWHCFAENADHPQKSDEWLKFVNSKYEHGEITVFCRDLIEQGARYEH